MDWQRSPVWLSAGYQCKKLLLASQPPNLSVPISLVGTALISEDPASIGGS